MMSQFPIQGALLPILSMVLATYFADSKRGDQFWRGSHRWYGVSSSSSMYRGTPVWLDRNDHHCTGGKNIQSQNRPIRRPEGLWIYHWWGLIFIRYQLNINCFIYRKRGKIHWTKLLRFSQFSAVPQNYFHKYKCLSLIMSTYALLMAKAMRKYFRENFDGAETVNI